MTLTNANMLHFGIFLFYSVNKNIAIKRCKLYEISRQLDGRGHFKDYFDFNKKKYSILYKY